jgi:hypothetical protein
VSEKRKSVLSSSLDIFVLQSVKRYHIHPEKLKNSELVKAAELISEDRRRIP